MMIVLLMTLKMSDNYYNVFGGGGGNNDHHNHHIHSTARLIQFQFKKKKCFLWTLITALYEWGVCSKLKLAPFSWTVSHFPGFSSSPSPPHSH